MKKILSLIALTSFALFAKAEIEFPEIVSDNMVLQQQADAKLWGWATPKSEVKVSTSWTGDKEFIARADAKTGRWNVSIPTGAASFDPQTVTFAGDGSEITLSNVLIGEVWLYSGQSNMEMPLRGFWTQPVEGSAQAIAYSGKYPHIRVATVPKTGAYQPQERTKGSWKVSSPENAPEFTAVGYFFAQSLSDILNVPVGIISCAYGGAKLESWLPAEIVAEYPEFDVVAEENGTKPVDEWHRAVVRYNAMLHPLIGYTIKGFLWNQGESNVGAHKQYPAHMADLINCWREKWGQGELPFIQVELPGWNYGNPEGDAAALMREAQRIAANEIPGCEIVSTVDLMYPYELEDIHASQKQPIGERMAFMAAAKTYGLNTIAHVYPELTDIKIEGNKAILRFDNVEGFLTPNDVLEGFEVAGEDKVFYPASTIMDSGEKHDVIVTAPEQVKEIKSVRYCFKNFNIGKVHGMDGLPLVPFRTDDWE